VEPKAGSLKLIAKSAMGQMGIGTPAGLINTFHIHLFIIMTLRI
jgi:hypothetical protein